MSQKNLLLFVLVWGLLLMLVYSMKQNAYREFIAQKEQLVKFEKEAAEIGMLKKRFGDRKTTRRLIDTLRRIATPKKEFVKGNTKVLEFDQLDHSKLNALLRKIGNSGLVIKKLHIAKVDDLHAKLRLELAK